MRSHTCGVQVNLATEIDLENYYTVPDIVAPRPPALCKGCGHRDVYDTLNEVLREFEASKIFGDIGCYTLGSLPPFRAIDTCVDMGASITMAKGAADAGAFPAIAIIGDSTFTHSGMTGLLDCVNEHSNVTIIISDNETTAMTGGQDSAGTGRIESICLGIGVDRSKSDGILQSLLMLLQFLQLERISETPQTTPKELAIPFTNQQTTDLRLYKSCSKIS